jgi:hypothetical protein
VFTADAITIFTTATLLTMVLGDNPAADITSTSNVICVGKMIDTGTHEANCSSQREDDAGRFRVIGQAGYDPGKLVESKDVALGADDSKTLAALIQNLNFFQMSTEDDRICSSTENWSGGNAVQWTGSDNRLERLWPAKYRFRGWLQRNVARLDTRKRC